MPDRLAVAVVFAVASAAMATTLQGCGGEAEANSSRVADSSPSSAGAPLSAQAAESVRQDAGDTKATRPTGARSQGDSTPWTDAFLEETGAPIYLQLERTTVFMHDAFTMVELTPWRRVRAGETESAIRLGFGSGFGLQQNLRDEMRREAAVDQMTDEQVAQYNQMMQWMGFGADQYFEAEFYQLKSDEVDSLIRFIEGVEAINIRQPAKPVRGHFVQATWGDLTVRREGGGLFVWIRGDINGWAPLNAERFLAGLREARRGLDELRGAEPAVRW